MSFFVLCDKEKFQNNVDRHIKRMAENGFSKYLTIDLGSKNLILFNDLSGNTPVLKEVENGDFIVSLGTFSYQGSKSLLGLNSLLNNFNTETFTWQEMTGTYVVILRKAGCTYLISDGLGCNQIYVDAQCSVYSNSFVSMCDITEPKFFDTQACYEYVINGAVFGNKSLLKGISTLPANSILKITGQKTQNLQLKSPVLDNDNCAANMTLDQVASYHCKQLDSAFEPIANAYGDNIKLSFSGGFDSRLSLAMLMQHGVKPKLFVYGNDNDEDVVIAQTVAKAESLELECINKSTAPTIELDSYNEITQANFYAFDGWKVEYGIFDFGTDRNDRLKRHVNEQIPLNGSLGEIYRNFFYIPDKKMRAQDVVSTFYSQYNQNAFSSKFKEAEYREEMAACMKNAINSSNEHLERYQIEQLYPHFRGRFWTGRDAQLNQRFGKMLFPFLEPAAISNTSKIPLNYKDLGYLQGRMISQVNSRLANYPSDYGFSLNGVRPLKYRLKTFLSTQRPPFTRKLSFRLKNRHKEALDTPLSQPYLSRVIDEDFPIMRNLFNIDLINSAKQYGLIATLEYLGERYNLEVK
ncbi:hypothetical protein [Neptunomonas japonica]|uniref:hypothetical protein n=1 Tax=Neptunomonas japonica TaxID=417574 RepID=UPI00040D392F|nr:hypothetical protein [Neptunomonas japonica]